MLQATWHTTEEWLKAKRVHRIRVESIGRVLQLTTSKAWQVQLYYKQDKCIYTTPTYYKIEYYKDLQ